MSLVHVWRLGLAGMLAVGLAAPTPALGQPPQQPVGGQPGAGGRTGAPRARPPAPPARAPKARRSPKKPGATPKATRRPRGRVVERVVAVVNDDIVLFSELQERFAPIAAELRRRGGLPPNMDELQLRVLNSLVDDRLILVHARKLKLGVTSREIDRALESVRQQNKVDMDELRQALKQQGMTMARYRQELRRQILRLKVINAAVRSRVSVSTEEVRTYYQRHVRQAGVQRTVRASHIFLAIPTNATAQDVARIRSFARTLVKQARGGADFAALARAHSQDPATKDAGGDLGFFSRGSLPPAVEEIVFNMEVGDVRGPVRAGTGFHVIKLQERKDEGVKPFAEVKERLRQQLYQQQLEKATKSWLQEIRKRAHVELRL